VKFNCGDSPETKERKKKEKFKERIESLVKWHRWFAWFPVRVDENDCRWLEYVETRLEPVYSSYKILDHSDTWWYQNWQYREISK
jgi:hypothetical protein